MPDRYTRPPTDTEVAHYISGQLARILDKQDELAREITIIKVQIGQLQVKSGIWGALSGAVAGIGAMLLIKAGK